MTRIIDAHVHIPDNGIWSDSISGINIASILKDMDRSGIEKAVILSMPGINTNSALYRLVQEAKHRFICFAWLDPNNSHLEDNLHELVEVYGFKGLKFHPRLQGIDPLDQKMEHLYRLAISMDLPILFDAYPQSSTMLIEKLLPLQYDYLAKSFPDLKIIIAHAGGHRLWDAYFVARSNPNVYMDLSYIGKVFEGTSLWMDLKIMLNYLDRKIIYGSDYPETDIFDYLQLIRKLIDDLPKPKQENIFSQNLLALLNMD